jgi:HAE1 family hydrophobic/amphiphilic exporter-1
VARVALGVETYSMIPRLGATFSNGKKEAKPAAIVALYQAPGSNAVELAENIKAEMVELSASFPEGHDL